MSASEWKPVRELGKAERTDRPEADMKIGWWKAEPLNLFSN
jgi:hypothetical protein